MYLIVGLGNPESDYSKTRHNMGFNVINKLSEKYGIEVNKTKFKGLVGNGMIEGEKVILLKPQTFMNLSGESIIEAMNFYKINTFEDVSTGKFGIWEPKVLENKQNQLDLLIIPLVACNEDGYRLGMGGGYYDRFISKYPTYTIGIAYQFQYIDFIPESHDLRFDLLITDEKIYRFGN